MWFLRQVSSRLAVISTAVISTAVIGTAALQARRGPHQLFSDRYHSTGEVTKLKDMRVRLIPALEDNYMYLLIDDTKKVCAVVDPVEPQKVLKAVREEKVALESVLTTHHHWDHAGGNENLIAETGPLKVYGGDVRIQGLTEKITEGDYFYVGSLKVLCLHTPCHTSGHMCYYVKGHSGDQPVVFTGDTLFIGGCGKFFEGTGEQMYAALYGHLGKLPDETRVFCGHEYTVNNLKFAEFVEPYNGDIRRKQEWAEQRRNERKPTVPSTIGEERLYNPFMRVGEAPVMKHSGLQNPKEIMNFLRREKDNFKPPVTYCFSHKTPPPQMSSLSKSSQKWNICSPEKGGKSKKKASAKPM